MKRANETTKEKESIKSMLNNFVDSCILVQCQISNGSQEKKQQTKIYTAISELHYIKSKRIRTS